MSSWILAWPGPVPVVAGALGISQEIGDASVVKLGSEFGSGPGWIPLPLFSIIKVCFLGVRMVGWVGGTGLGEAVAGGGGWQIRKTATIEFLCLQPLAKAASFVRLSLSTLKVTHRENESSLH